jgi:hypothetical protein
MSFSNPQQMNKHKFNIFPQAKPEDYNRLRDDIRDNGFDQKQPVIVYQGAILDGWNRWTACEELKVTPTTRQFEGTDTDALDFVMRTNKRRNLNSGQWAMVSADYQELKNGIANAVEAERRARISQSRKTETAQKIAPSEKSNRETRTKTAELFSTNRTYVSQAAKIKEAAPEIAEKVKAGKMTMQDAARAVRAIPTEPWLEDEQKRKMQVENGEGVIANTSRDKNLIQWAERQGLMVRIDRSTEYGNPFILGDDGTRDEVCDAYAKYYLPHKPSIKAKLANLRGKVLVCHCYPERCHGEALLKEVQ